MKKLRANVCAVTHAGRIRKENEDNYNLNGRMTSTGDLKKGSAFVQSMTEPFHLSVCDGMGGENYGELASGIAVETIAAHASNVYESGEDFSFAISNCLDDANSRICAEINARGKRMGTTLAAIYAVKGKIYCVNIGDTRVYHYSKGILEQISFDHTHAQTIVDAGEVSQDNISRIPDAKRLTRHLGVFPEEGNLSPNISVVDDVDDGDVILLCSDGLTDMLNDSEITAILSTGENSQTVASKLIRKALENGGKDNITVMAAFISVEETAIFAPIAAAMVGDSDADYEEEYRNSFGSNQMPDEENYVSPYANADARAYKKPIDKAKIMKIAGIAIAAVAAVLITALIIKAFVVGDDGDDNITSSGTTSSVNTYPQYIAPDVIETWDMQPTTESTTEETTTTTTTKKQTTTKKKPSTTKRPSTTRKPETTTEPVTEETTEDITEETNENKEPTNETPEKPGDQEGENGDSDNGENSGSDSEENGDSDAGENNDSGNEENADSDNGENSGSDNEGNGNSDSGENDGESSET